MRPKQIAHSLNLCWLTAALLGLGPIRLCGQESVLDSSFQVGTGTDEAVNAILVQKDGHLFVGGEFNVIHGQSNAWLARLKSDGAVDTSFNPPGQTDGAVWCMVQQSDGKILVGGAFHHLLGAERQGLARLTPDGLIDASFDAGGLIGDAGCVFALGLDGQQRVLVGYQLPGADIVSCISRLATNGVADPTWTGTLSFPGYPFALLPLADGALLVGANPVTNNPAFALFRLDSDGNWDAKFSSGLELSSVFRLVRKPDGSILVAGLLKPSAARATVPLLQMTPALQWDDNFQPDLFGAAPIPGASISELLLQPDGKMVVGGNFGEVGGYARLQVARLSAEGRIDACFDPGLGLGREGQSGSVRSMALQTDNHIVVGGAFSGVDTAWHQRNLARLLPSCGCDLIRVYLVPPVDSTGSVILAATLPPGGTHVLEQSENLKDWTELERTTNSYMFHPLDVPAIAPGAKFFRAVQLP